MKLTYVPIILILFCMSVSAQGLFNEPEAMSTSYDRFKDETTVIAQFSIPMDSPVGAMVNKGTCALKFVHKGTIPIKPTYGDLVCSVLGIEESGFRSNTDLNMIIDGQRINLPAMSWNRDSATMEYLNHPIAVDVLAERLPYDMIVKIATAKKVEARFGRAWEFELQQSAISVIGEFVTYGAIKPDALMAAVDRDIEAANTMERAQQLFDARNFEGAVALARPVADNIHLSKLRRALAYVLVGQCYAGKGLPDAAIGSVVKAMDLLPPEIAPSDMIKLHLMVARLYLANSDIESAKKYLANAMSIDPNNPDALALDNEIKTRAKKTKKKKKEVTLSIRFPTRRAISKNGQTISL